MKLELTNFDLPQEPPSLIADLSNKLLSQFDKKIEDLIVEGLKRKGFEFGSRMEMENFIKLFENIFLDITPKEQKLYSEEQFISLIYADNKELFNPFYFDTWLHENNITKDYPPNYLNNNKSFYKVLEEIKQ
jgi:hypothetical protein